jgi:hypothetical protein
MAVEMFALVWAADVSRGGVGGGGFDPPMVKNS